MATAYAQSNYASKRRAQLAQVHILRKELNIPEDEYRLILFKLCGRNSAADLDAPGLDLWCKHLQNLKNKYKKPKHNYELTAREKRIWSLWQELADSGAVNNRKMDGLVGYIKTHVAFIDHISWLNAAQQDNLIEQLKKWLDRLKIKQD